MFSESLILKIRGITLIEALKRIGATYYFDNTFRPRKNQKTRLVLIDNQGKHVDMIVTEPVFLLHKRGTRERIGKGRGAIDLVIALKKCSFPAAVRLLMTGV